VSAVQNLSGRWIRLLGEIEARAMLHVFKERNVFVAEQPGQNRNGRLRLLCNCERGAKE
jgi:hypothetical protein